MIYLLTGLGLGLGIGLAGVATYLTACLAMSTP